MKVLLFRVCGAGGDKARHIAPCHARPINIALGPHPYSSLSPSQRPLTAEVEVIGHDCDLAILRVNPSDEADFFAGTTPVEFGELPQSLVRETRAGGRRRERKGGSV